MHLDSEFAVADSHGTQLKSNSRRRTNDIGGPWKMLEIIQGHVFSVSVYYRHITTVAEKGNPDVRHMHE